MLPVRSKRSLFQRGQSLAEFAVVAPVFLLVMMAMFNLAMAGFAAVSASNAANYGARRGSVVQGGGAAAVAGAAAQQQADTLGVGEYSVSAYGGGRRGAQVVVVVDWTVPNFIGGLMAFVGADLSSDFSGSVTSSFRQEGW
jgi:Flp pilus assembly protein TadG